MKECEDCKYFDGPDRESGLPICNYKEGYEGCPYNYEGDVEEDKFKITLDIPEINTLIKHAVQNTLQNSVYKMIELQVKSVVDQEIKNVAKEYADEALKESIDKEISAYMQRDITVGGGWASPERILSREAYLSECISKALDEKLKPEEIKKIVTESCRSTIDSRLATLKNDINTGIKCKFDEATRKTLSENVVTLLMAGDTYKRLSDSTGSLLK